MMINNRTQKRNSSCEMCGDCCHMEIPLTLLSIKRIAELRDTDEKEIFRDSVQKNISKLSSLFMIKKNHEGACIFLFDIKKCSIHSVKPGDFRFYSCDLDPGENHMFWTAICIDPSQLIKLWEQSVASIVTKAYVRNNCPAWNWTDYDKAIRTISDNIVTEKNQKIKLAREIHGEVLAMAFTREYVNEFGTIYRKNTIVAYLIKIDKISIDSTGFKKICSRIAPFRYVDDTLAYWKDNAFVHEARGA